MNLSKLFTNKSHVQRNTLRTLSTDERRAANGGTETDDYFTFYEGYDYLKIVKDNSVFQTK